MTFMPKFRITRSRAWKRGSKRTFKKKKNKEQRKKKGNERGVGVIILSTCVAGAHNSVTTDKIHRPRVVVNLKAVRVSSAYIKRERWMELTDRWEGST